MAHLWSPPSRRYSGFTAGAAGSNCPSPETHPRRVRHTGECVMMKRIPLAMLVLALSHVACGVARAGTLPAPGIAERLDPALLGPELVPGGDFETDSWSADVAASEGYWRTGRTPVEWTGHHLVFDPVGPPANRGLVYAAKLDNPAVEPHPGPAGTHYLYQFDIKDPAIEGRSLGLTRVNAVWYDGYGNHIPLFDADGDPIGALDVPVDINAGDRWQRFSYIITVPEDAAKLQLQVACTAPAVMALDNYSVRDATAALAAAGIDVIPAGSAEETPGAAPEQLDTTQADGEKWFNREKIRFFWGQWGQFDGPDGLSWEELMQDLSEVGVTVCTARTGRSSARARIAHRYGIRFLAAHKLCTAPAIGAKLRARAAVNRHGRTAREEKANGMQLNLPFVPCPLDERVIHEWLLKPTLRLARPGVVDGFHIDWESYGFTGFDRAGDYLCYCDDCFGTFMKQQERDEQIPRTERYTWLQTQQLLRVYLLLLRDRVRDVFREVADRVREVNPDFLFSGYETFAPGELENYWRTEGAALGLGSADVPFFIIDAGHYWPNHTAPWWETGYAANRKLGLRHILGTWTGGIQGGHPEMDVSAVDWMYEAAISHDGYWVWFEHRWGPEDYAMYRAAEQRISATERKVGDFLSHGERDSRFVCVVEQSGDPVLGRNVIQRAYHLDVRHLVRVSNVNTDTPATSLVRFPALPAGVEWTVQDPMSDLYYTHSGSETLWTRRELSRGVLVVLEKRNDAWLLLAPGPAAPEAVQAATICAEPISGHPARPASGRTVPSGSANAAEFPLVYVKTERLDYRGSIVPVTGTSLHFVDATGQGKDAKRLFGIKGNCWSPALSPDAGRIAFSCYVNGRGQIYTVNADGTHPFNVSSNEFCERSPAWSPDGSRIAFESDRDGNWEVYVMNADGTEQKRLTRSVGADTAPAWSPDGTRIAFEADRDGDVDICLVNVDGAEERVLVNRSANERQPVWSPDGKRIACTVGVRGFHRDVLVLDARDGSIAHPKGLSHAAKDWWQYTNMTDICWSPDGSRVAGAFEKWEKSGIFVVKADGTELRELLVTTPLKPYPGGEVAHHKLVGGWYFNGSASRRWLVHTFKDLAWSPDGSRIAFCSDTDASGYFFHYTIAGNGGPVTRLDATLSPADTRNKPEPIRGGTGAEKVSGFAASPAYTARYLDGEDRKRMLARLTQLAELPVDGWAFKDDPERKGTKQGFFRVDYADSDLPKLRVDKLWDDQGYPANMPEGWYRLRYAAPELPSGKRVFLDFGAIDESGWLYIDGQLAAWYDTDEPGKTWNQPVLLEVTGTLSSGQEHLLAVRVGNSAGAGGIWKPVRLMIEK